MTIRERLRERAAYHQSCEDSAPHLAAFYTEAADALDAKDKWIAELEAKLKRCNPFFRTVPSWKEVPNE